MEAKLKAEELVNQFLEKIPFADKNVYEDWEKEMNDKAKQCALIAVDEIIENLVELSNGEFTFIHNVEYWNEVRNEILNLSF